MSSTGAIQPKRWWLIVTAYDRSQPIPTLTDCAAAAGRDGSRLAEAAEEVAFLGCSKRALLSFPRQTPSVAHTAGSALELDRLAAGANPAQ